MPPLKSEGVCSFCKETMSKQAMTRHVASHLEKMEKEATQNTKRKYYHISITAAEMFLVLLIESETSFEQLDDFFRDIWVECCGHMSSFRTKSGITIMDNDFGFGDESFPMETSLSKVYQKGLQMMYEYDFGSTTYFEVKFVGEYELPTQRRKITLVSRNEPLPILCQICKEQPAEQICAVHMYEGGFFCKKCARKHKKECEDFEDYAKMPVVNSPRMGMCDYDGGSIDKKRDGVYKLKEA